MDFASLKASGLVVTGLKQTLRAVLSGRARQVYLARDADERVKRQVLDACVKMAVPISFVDRMADLGKSCGIKVDAATAAVLLEQ
ncbi:MAG: Ribosome-associated protein L7Ae-like protein [Syntrophomonadaceae bacterium]|nr:Ribosome-associated protein L7Ae-like protein [Bacillota bacterium]